MSINPISFGKVTAVSGKPRKMDRLNESLSKEAKNGKVMIKDVTGLYKTSFIDGLMGQAAKKGDKVSVYITGNDIAKIKNREPNWDSINGIISNLQAYYNLETISVSDTIKRILSK